MVQALGNEVLSELYQSLGARQQRVAMRALPYGRLMRAQLGSESSSKS